MPQLITLWAVDRGCLPKGHAAYKEARGTAPGEALVPPLQRARPARKTVR